VKVKSGIALIGLFLAIAPGLATGQSVVGSIEKGMKRLEHNLCKVSPSEKCRHSKTRKAKASKPVSPVPRPAPPPKTSPAPESKAPIVRQNPVPVPQPRPAELVPAKPDKRIVPIPVPKVAPIQPKAMPPAPKPLSPVPPPQVEVPHASVQEDGNCLAALMKAGASFSPVPQPGKETECKVENPVRVNSISSKDGTVKLPDEPTLNCAFALAFTSWVEATAQPLAKASQGAGIVAMGTGPGFDCRGRNGDASAKISEHGTGNAVDIATISFANKQQMQVKDAINPQAAGFGFLRDLRAAACTTFTTVLGPGANSAHAEHFHIDLAQRKGGYRICE
jgi:hypothetical protein